MLTAHDLVERYGVTLNDIGEWYARKILPGAVRVGGKLRFREEDIELFDEHLRALIDWEEAGNEPFSPDAPAPPAYSTGRPGYDPRATMARLREQERRERSKTLAAGADPMPAELPVKMPRAPGVTRSDVEQ